jgi:large subunit ribosomal protein L21
VTAEVVEQGKEKKIIVFKFKRKSNYFRKQGHRQQYTAVKIKEIAA